MSKRKKILIITNDFYPSRGGIQETVFGLARQFGDRCVILAPYYSGYNIKMDERFNFSIVRTNGLRQDRFVDNLLFFALRRPFMFLIRTVFLINRTIRGRDYSFVICGHITNILIGIMAKRILNVPLGTIIHGKELLFVGVLRQLRKNFVRYLLGSCDYLFMSNHFVKKTLLEMNIPEEKILLIPFGVNFSKRQKKVEKRLGDNKKTILTVGRLVERKGHEVVLRALPMVLKRFPNVIYQIVGKGPMEKKLQELAKEMKLSKYVEFYGEVENTESFYQNCDIFVMPSRFIEEKGDVEGFGLVFLEANFFGKPVIAGRSGGVSDAVVGGVTGTLVDPENPEEIANAIIKLLENPELAHKLGEQGRQRVLTEFTWERAASIIEQTMTEAKVGNKRVSRSFGESVKRRR